MNFKYHFLGGLLGVSLLAHPVSVSSQTFGNPVPQRDIQRVNLMPDLPSSYEMLDWRAKAVGYDRFVFNWNRTEGVGPLIWSDNSRRNINQPTFGLYTAIGDIRQGPAHNQEFHESVNTMAAVLGAGLVGIDKTRQDGCNYVKMLQNYFNSDNGWNIMMNNTCEEVGKLGGGYGRDWWYNILPNALFYAVSDVFPHVQRADSIQRVIAEQFVKADSVLHGNYNYSSFDYSRMQGIVNNIPFQQDAAGGHAYVLLCAYKKFGDKRYLEHSKSALDALNGQKESRFYEILLPLGIYTAAYLNATENTHYDLQKMFNWVFDGCKSETGRNGWGVIVGKWGKYDVSGLQGSLTDGGGYAFLMNSIKLSWPFVPLVKYQPQYARAIGKWMLNNASACRLFYPEEMDSLHQWNADMRHLTEDNVSYEGLRKTDFYGKPSLRGVSPVAMGDGPRWINGNPPQTMFSVYSSSPVGILGAIVSKTNVRGILRLDCNATDFYMPRLHPEYLYFNPYHEEKQVTYYAGKGSRDLFDIISRRYMARNIKGSVDIHIPANCAIIIVELPAKTKLTKSGNKIMVNQDDVICY
jgi:hypothetical protein